MTRRSYSVPAPALTAIAAVAAAGALAGYRYASRRPVAPATYPPLDLPKPFAEDIWVVDSGPIHAGGLTLPVRMTVIRLDDGALLLHSPISYTPALAAALEALGPVRHLVAPNVAHWTYLPRWQRAFPRATLWAAPGLAERAQVRRAGLRIDSVLGDEAPSAWGGAVDQGVIEGGAGFRETWFLHRATRTLVLTDLVQNLEPERLPAITALVARATRGTAGTTPLYLRAALRLGGEPMRAAITSMVALAPERVVMAHGAPFTSGGAARLRSAFAWV
ncbi:DUF4336 domain-containing protein [Sphingomonas sp. BK580]|uniref:DUF4336 domain-containing protein n=1 Tax=Sphingomonas sp. BK580 TaxID=2586972 RepID=UPI001615BA1F|nr:DUF4336 domain-containing protein [Sphingomonas sp. BK580]MBB3691759.1 hypothetical protein [Sphingomonas sp. BK580]